MAALYVKASRNLKLKEAIKSSIELILLAIVVDVIAAYVIFQYIVSGTVQIWFLVHTGIPASIQLTVYIISAIICSYGAFSSVKCKLRSGRFSAYVRDLDKNKICLFE